MTYVDAYERSLTDRSSASRERLILAKSEDQVEHSLRYIIWVMRG